MGSGDSVNERKVKEEDLSPIEKLLPARCLADSTPFHPHGGSQEKKPTLDRISTETETEVLGR